MESAKWLKEKVVSLMETGAYEDAAPFLERLLALPGSNPFDTYFGHFTLGEIHFQAQRWARAQKHFQKALDVNDNDPYALLLLGQVLCAQGKYHKGREILDKVWRMKPGDVIVEITLATCLCMQGEYAEAEEIFRRIISREEMSHEPYLGMAQCLMGQFRWDDARKTLEEARKKFPTVLVIRQALKDLDKVDQLEDFYNWITEEELDGAFDGALDEWESIPIDLARTAMAEMEFAPEAIKGAEKLWDDYLRVGFHMPRVPEAWAAGIVYTVSKLFGRSDLSQSELARRFDVSATSVSRVFRTLSDDLKIKLNDSRYKLEKKKK